MQQDTTRRLDAVLAEQVRRLQRQDYQLPQRLRL
jgi:hypothetical protein